MTTIDRRRLEAALAGDPDASDGVFATGVAFVDHTAGERLHGLDEVRQHWAEFAGRRPVAAVAEVVRDGRRAAVRYTVAFRTDAAGYAQSGTAWVSLDDDGRITSWDAVWVETGADAAMWVD